MSIETDKLRATIRVMQEHHSREVMCSIQWELHNDPKLSVRQIAHRAGMGESSIRSWLEHNSSPTLESIRRVARGLHPEGRYSDPIEWLKAGRQFLNHLISRLEQMERWERRQALRAKLGSTAAVDVVLEVIEEDLPEELLGELARRLEARPKEDKPKG
ncbi:MAG: hypothetical protein GY856_41155 [bacterium]|nr:hypothetical protein [bacterium]